MAEPSSGLSAGWVAALTVVTALLGAAAGFGGAVATGWFAYASKDEELRVRLVEIAISILEADPSKTDLTPARGWAMDVIDEKSGVKFSAEDRAALLKKPIQSSEEWSAKKMLWGVQCLNGDSWVDCYKKQMQEPDKGMPKP